MRRSPTPTGRQVVLAGALLACGALMPVLALILAPSSQATPKPPPAPKPPLATTGGATAVSYSSVALNGTVNPRGTEASCYFQYGPTTAYGSQTPTVAVGSGTVGVKVSQPISGLPLGTPYHYRLVAVSSSTGLAGNGQDRTFTTRQIPLKFVINRASTVDVFESPFTVSGTLTGTGGANHPVILQADPFPYVGGFTDVGTPESTNAEGGFSLVVPSLTQTTQLHVRTLDATPVYSQTVTVRVAVKVTLQAHAAGRGSVRLSGTVAPAAVGAPVVFQRVGSGRPPVKVGSAVVRLGTASFSRFSATVRIRHGGLYRALVQMSNGRQVSGSSPTVLLRGAPAARRTHHPHRRRR